MQDESVSDLSEDDGQQIKDLHDRWVACELAGDVQGLLQLCTDDVQWLVPDRGLLIGKAAARALLAEPGAQLRAIETADVRIRGGGSFAYKTSNYSTRYTVADGSEVRVNRGTHLWILRKTDGEWQVALVTWQAATT